MDHVRVELLPQQQQKQTGLPICLSRKVPELYSFKVRIFLRVHFRGELIYGRGGGFIWRRYCGFRNWLGWREEKKKKEKENKTKNLEKLRLQPEAVSPNSN